MHGRPETPASDKTQVTMPTEDFHATPVPATLGNFLLLTVCSVAAPSLPLLPLLPCSACRVPDLCRALPLLLWWGYRAEWLRGRVLAPHCLGHVILGKALNLMCLHFFISKVGILRDPS